jgi:chromosome partitioning protein
MIITVTNFKGGVGKTTTAIHLAAFLQQDKPTLLVDGDVNRSATAWGKRGQLPFTVVDERAMAKQVRNFEHVVIDTQARPSGEDLKALAEGCDLLVVPTSPDMVSIDALLLTVDSLKTLRANHYKILLTMIPPKPRKDGQEACSLFQEANIPMFQTMIRRLVAFEKAGLQGVIVSQVKDPRAQDGWLDYTNVAKEILL